MASFVARLRKLDDVPERTGRYIVLHSGMSGGDAYYTARAGDTHYPVGWSQLPEIRPSHWLDAPDIDFP